MLHLIRSKGFDFLGNAPKFVSISAVATLLCLGVLLMKGERNLGADFRGGDLLVISAAHKLTPDELRGALAHSGFKTALFNRKRWRIAISSAFELIQAPPIKSKRSWSEALPTAGLKFEQTDHVGALVGKELAQRAHWLSRLGC